MCELRVYECAYVCLCMYVDVCEYECVGCALCGCTCSGCACGQCACAYLHMVSVLVCGYACV